MTSYSKFLSLLSGIDTTVDLSNSSNALAVANMQLLGSTSGVLTHIASPTTTSYTLTWPAAVAASNGYVLTSTTAGVLSWSAPATSGITQLTGDVTAGPGTGSQVASLVATSNATLTTLSALTTASSLASIGTVTSGTWHGTAIGPTYGGTGQTTYTTGDTLYASATNVLSKLAIGTTGQVLTVSSGIPAWATPAATTVTYLVAAVSDGNSSDGPNINISAPGSTFDNGSVTPTTGQYILLINQTTGTNDGVWQFNGSASPLTRPPGWTTGTVVPAGTLIQATDSKTPTQWYSGTLWSLQAADTVGTSTPTFNIIGFDPTYLPNASLVPSTGSNSMNLGSASNTFQSLYLNTSIYNGSQVAINISGHQLRDNSGNTNLNWQAKTLSSGGNTIIDWGNSLLEDSSGNTQLSWSTSGVGIGADGATAGLLTIFNTNSGGGVTIQNPSTVTAYNFNLPTTAGTAGQVLKSGGGGSTAMTWGTASTGTVTSVAFSDASTTPIYTISGSPVTTSGTLTQTLTTQTANTVFAGPSSGSAAQPTFRALVSADIPNLSATYVTQAEVGVASGVASLDGTGKIPLAQLPSAVFIYQGTWNPNTNTPTLVDGTGTTGYVYWVSAAKTGTVSGLSNASMVNFQIGDLVIYNGTQWELTTPAAGVSSVNTAQGAVVLTVASANGFAGTYSTTALTLSTTITGILQGNGTAISAATTTGTGNVVLSASPTLTGTVGVTNITATGTVVSPTFGVSGIYSGAATLAANTTYAMRWGLPANSETAGHLYVADWSTTSYPLYWVVGLYNSTSTTATGATITVTDKGSFTLGSSDTTFSSTDQGKAVWLGASGAITANSAFSPTAGDANSKIGVSTGASTIWVAPQMMGIS